MRAERSWYYALLIGAFVTLAFYAGELKRGTDIEVRYAWVEATHAFVALIALLGLGLASWRPRTQLAGKVAAGAGMGALATHLLLVLTVPLRPGEAPHAILWAALDVLGWAALPGALIVATHPGMSPRVSRVAIWLAGILAAALAARLMWSALTFPSPLRVGLGVAWTGFVLASGWSVTRELLRMFGSPAPASETQTPTPQATPR